MTHPLPLEVRFLKRYARQLHMAGVPAHQFERMMISLADKLGFNCQVLSSPTSIFLSFQYQDDEDDSRPIPMQLDRMDPPTINLGNTAELYDMGNCLLDGEVSLEQAYAKLRFWQPQQIYPVWLQIICWGLTGGAVAVMLSASWVGIAAAALSGALIRVPGVILLVPGTVGYHGATALFLEGGADLTDTSLLALRLLIALVGGLLFGNTLLPPRRGH